MRIVVYTAFVAFWSVIATLLLLHRIEPEPNPREPRSRAASEAREQAVSMAEIASHATREDCWMAIDGVAYDLSAYVPRHPSREETLVAWCGREASEAMRTKNGQGPHSPRAWRLLERYRMGPVSDPQRGAAAAGHPDAAASEDGRLR